MAGEGSTAPSSGLPGRALAFLIGVGVAAVGVSAAAIAVGWEVRALWTFAVLTTAASVTQLFAFHTIRNQVFHTTPLLIVAAVLLLPPELVVLVPLLSHVLDWVRKKYAWYIQTFNILNFTLAAMAAWLAHRAVADAVTGRGSWAAAAAAAAATFVVLNNLGFAVVIHLARGHSVREILNPQTLSADAALACLGVALADFWRADAWLVPFALAPIFLLHAALRIPELAEEARVDAKTGLSNARAFREALDEELTRARRFDRPLSVIVADLDLLRNVNNTYGHLAGDAVLAGIADILRNHLRQYDVAARFGGEEFALVLPETALREAWQIAERIREAAARTPIWAESVREWITVTLSLGVATFPAHGSDPDDLLHHADLAAYHAKLRGRNRVQRARRGAMLTGVARDTLISYAVDDGEPAPRPAEATVVHAPHADPRARSGTYVLVAAVGALAAAGGVTGIVLGGTRDLIGLGVAALVVAAGQAIALDGDDGAISAGAVAALAGVALFGVRAALPLAAISIVVDVALRRWPPLHATLTLAARTLGLLTAAVIFDAGFGGLWGKLVTLGVGPLAGAASFAVTAAVLGLALALQGRDWSLRGLRERFAWLVPHYAVYGFVAAAAAVVYPAIGIYALAAFGVALLAIRRLQEAFVGQARRNAVNLRHATEMIQSQALSLQRMNQLEKERSTSAAESLSSVIDKRDSYTAGHSRRVRDLALAVGREVGMSQAELDSLGWAALFHDIGKLAIPEAILLKPSSLDEHEWEVVRRHPEEGVAIVTPLGFLEAAIPAIRHHHERVDGTGYPDGLAGDEIPLAARIIQVVDAYDSMRTNRVYRPPRAPSEAFGELRALAGRQFDRRCVVALERVLASGSFKGEETAVAGARAHTNGG